MQKTEVKAMLDREPFVPLRIHVSDGRKVDVPFRHVAIVLEEHLLVMKGVKSPTSRQATGYEYVGYDYIDRIEPQRPRPRKKAS